MNNEKEMIASIVRELTTKTLENLCDEDKKTMDRALAYLEDDLDLNLSEQAEQEKPEQTDSKGMDDFISELSKQ